MWTTWNRLWNHRIQASAAVCSESDGRRDWLQQSSTQLLRTTLTSLGALELRSQWMILRTLERWMPVSRDIWRVNWCVLALSSSWLSNYKVIHSTVSVFSRQFVHAVFRTRSATASLSVNATRLACRFPSGLRRYSRYFPIPVSSFCQEIYSTAFVRRSPSTDKFFLIRTLSSSAICMILILLWKCKVNIKCIIGSKSCYCFFKPK